MAVRPRQTTALSSPLARSLLVELRTGPGPDGSWYGLDLAQWLGVNIAQVTQALAALERDGYVVSDMDALGRIYRATDAGRAKGLQIRAREERERSRARRQWWSDLAGELPDMAAALVGLIAFLAVATLVLYLLLHPEVR